MTTLRIPIASQQAVMRCLRHYLALANAHLDSQYPEPKITYRQRGTSAGTAHLTLWEIRLNTILLVENGQQFIDEVIPHELAHLLVYRQFGRVSPHGSEWQWMMEKVLGVPASRTHNFNVRSVQGNTFPYSCLCQTHLLTVRRHNKILRKESEYRCKKCGQILKANNNI
ncbi:SprT-like family [Pragia fontium]|uniref:SprT family zinc-dependent metalloprotease n=1 Tax=Pragia fontium TaxID=82985 RepID=UPI000E07CB73|nr:SprT family zinc-dependent metalloprotease [Pragia fontium]SUB81403.1 SprT-like family [Pragia fontium]